MENVELRINTSLCNILSSPPWAKFDIRNISGVDFMYRFNELTRFQLSAWQIETIAVAEIDT
jgi:hypothetical protein